MGGGGVVILMGRGILKKIVGWGRGGGHLQLEIVKTQ